MARDRILTTHVGSLIRPPELIAYFEPMLKGEPYDREGFEKALREAVAEIVRRQAAIGLDIINDGELGKTHWYRYAVERFSGIESRPASPSQTYFAGKDRERFREFYAEHDKDLPRPTLEWAVTGPVTYRGAALLARDIDSLKAALAKTDAAGFLPVVAPRRASRLN
jgi:5-methyltetrahydropteroyltriglutamate--homocysteine methyltransferase